MTKEPMTDYELLKLTGFSPTKAQEIVIDAERGDKYAQDWIKSCRNIHNQPPKKP